MRQQETAGERPAGDHMSETSRRETSRRQQGRGQRLGERNRGFTVRHTLAEATRRGFEYFDHKRSTLETIPYYTNQC